MPKRKVTYKDLNLLQIKELATRGWTIGDIGNFFGVPYATLQDWVNKYPETLGSTLHQGIKESAELVERRLFERAIGYNCPETKVMSRALGNNRGSEIVKIEVTKHYPPDISAMIFYLTNKKREEWKHRMELHTDNGINRLPDMSELTFSQVMALAHGESANTATLKRNAAKRLKDEVKKTEQKSTALKAKKKVKAKVTPKSKTKLKRSL